MIVRNTWTWTPATAKLPNRPTFQSSVDRIWNSRTPSGESAESFLVGMLGQRQKKTYRNPSTQRKRRKAISTGLRCVLVFL